MKDITGMHIYYYMVCKRKLWYYIKEYALEDDNELVKVGKFIDEKSYSREEKHINIMNKINIDFIKDNTLYETKKSSSMEKASIWQMKYYLYVLKELNVNDFTGEINYPKQKQVKEVSLSDDDIIKIQSYCEDIKKISNLEVPPSQLNKKTICKNCAYHDLCFI